MRKDYKKERICKKCGKLFIHRSRNLICSTCRSKIRRNKRKKILVDYKGGKCELCGYNLYISALCFHHRNQSEKEFEIADNCRYTIEKLKAEVDKCSLLCMNCHTALHFGEL